MLGFDHGKPGGTTGNPVTAGAGGTIIDRSNPKQALHEGTALAGVGADVGRRTASLT